MTERTEARAGVGLRADGPEGPGLDLRDPPVPVAVVDGDLVIDLRDDAGRAGPFDAVRHVVLPLYEQAPGGPTLPARRVPPWVTLTLLVVGGLWLVRTGTVGAGLVVAAVLGSVAAHELAHLLVARAVGVRAEEFFVGFGPRLWSTRRAGTEWGVKLIPAGGYVKLVDEQGAAPWRKALIAAAGPVANLVLAVGLLVTVSVGGHLPTETGSTADLPLAEQVVVGVERTGESTVAAVDAVIGLPATIVGMGGAVAAGDDVPADAERLVSPVGIGRMADQASTAGWAMALLLVAVVNLALAVFNLVPVPPLDGGRVVAAGCEAALGRLWGRPVVLTGKGFERIGIAVVGVLLLAGLAALVLDVVHPLANPFGG